MSLMFDDLSAITTTENGALTFSTTLDPCLDLFSLGGALRRRESAEIISLIRKSWECNPQLTLEILFYLRDIRGGMGEKRVFVEGAKFIFDMLSHKACSSGKDPVDFEKSCDALCEGIIEMGCCKDLFKVFGSSEMLFSFIKRKIASLRKDETHLLFKWMPSIGGSKNAYAEKLASYLGMSPRQYRKMLSEKRALLNITETKMCADKWGEIDYKAVPSKASFLYGTAFRRHDEERYSGYLESVEKGEATINTSTLYPYEIAEKVLKGYYFGIDSAEIERLDIIWDNLPDYVSSDKTDTLIVADTSGSMSGRPMAVATSLAVYYSERNKGIFHNEFVTFSRNPRFYRFDDSDKASAKFVKMERMNICENTDIYRTFNIILDRAVEAGLSKEDMPGRIIVISDMEFDGAVSDNSATVFEAVRNLYADAGFKMPVMVFWNVNSHQNNIPVKRNEEGVVLVSGCSPSVFGMVMSDDINPVKFMLQTVTVPRYKEYAERILSAA